jgi:uncharacterized RDD family membrane protein YckC
MLENKGLRVINYAIDTLAITILSTLFNAFTLNNWPFQVYVFTYLLYYCLFETLLGQTLGKLLTKTKVVDTSNKRPSLIRVLARSVLRLNPLDVSSYLFGGSQGTHDTLSGTKLIRLNSDDIG